jgi:hypothetical protein
MRHADAVRRLPELVGLRAAGADHPALGVHVAGCSRCRARLDALRALDSGLRDLDAPPPVPERLERRVLAVPGVAGAGQRRNRRRRVAALAAALAVIVAGAIAGVVVTGDDQGAPGFRAERVVPLATSGPSAVSARVEIGAADGSRMPLRILATGLPHGGGRYYGLWLTGAGGAVSAGSFRPDGAGRCVVLFQVPAGDWRSLHITAGDRPPSRATTVAHAAL